MKCECGQYGLNIATLPDGTHIYHCVNCGELWGERLVKFQVSFQLVEVVGNGHDGSVERTPEVVVAAAFSS